MDTLPAELFIEIMVRLNDADLARFCGSSTRMYQICAADLMWQYRVDRLYSGRFTSHRVASWRKFYESLVAGGTVNILSDRSNMHFHGLQFISTTTDLRNFGYKYTLVDNRSYVKSIIVGKEPRWYLFRLTTDGTLLVNSAVENEYEAQITKVLDIFDRGGSIVQVLMKDYRLLYWDWEWTWDTITSMKELAVIDIPLARICSAGWYEKAYIISTQGDIYIVGFGSSEVEYEVDHRGRAIYAIGYGYDLYFITENGTVHYENMEYWAGLEVVYDDAPCIAYVSVINNGEYLLTGDGKILWRWQRAPQFEAIADIHNFTNLIHGDEGAFATTDDFKLYQLEKNVPTLLDTDVISAAPNPGSFAYIQRISQTVT